MFRVKLISKRNLDGLIPNTRFSERIEKKMNNGYPVSDFLNREELAYFYSPESMQANKQNGPDSLKYRSFEDSIS